MFYGMLKRRLTHEAQQAIRFFFEIRVYIRCIENILVITQFFIRMSILVKQHQIGLWNLSVVICGSQRPFIQSENLRIWCSSNLGLVSFLTCWIFELSVLCKFSSLGAFQPDQTVQVSCSYALSPNLDHLKIRLGTFQQVWYFSIS